MLNYKKPAFWIIIVSIIACIAVAACFLTNPITKKANFPENFKILTVSTDDYITISVKEVVLDTDNPYIKIEWKNGAESMLVYGEQFDIEYYDFENEDEPIRSCMTEDKVFPANNNYVKPGETEEKIYSLSGFDLSKDGVYEFSTYASYQYDNVQVSGNFAVIFGIGDVSEYEARLKENSDEERYDSIGSPIGLSADLNHNGVPDSLTLLTTYNKNQELESLRLDVAEEAENIFSEEAAASHAGWNALFLYRKDGQDYLLRYNPGMGTGSAGYSYQLFYIGKDGSEVIVQENTVRFDINFGSSVHQSFDSKDIDAFLNEINALLIDSIELINTDDDLIKSFQREGRQYHIPQFLFNSKDMEFAYDYDKTIYENLEKYRLTMEEYWAEAE